MAVRGGGGAYSKRNRELDKERWREQRPQDMKLSRDRAHTLSMETTQRQRAMENRKLIMLAAEEERRQKILSERRQFQRDATERFRLATERCKVGAGENAITSLPSAGITASLPSKPSSAKPAAPRSDEWESNVITARSNSAKRILSGKDHKLIRTPSKFQFLPLSSQQSLSSNDGAVPIRRGMRSDITHVVENEKRIPSSGALIAHSSTRPQQSSTVSSRNHAPQFRTPSATNLTYPEKTYPGIRNKTRRLYSSNSLMSTSSHEKITVNPVPLESSSEKPRQRVRFSIDGEEELTAMRVNMKPLSGIIKTTPKPPPVALLPKPKPVVAPPMVPATDEDSWDSLTPSEAGSECDDDHKHKEEKRNGQTGGGRKEKQPSKLSSLNGGEKGKEKISKGNGEYEGEEEDSEDSEETVFSESDLEKGEEAFDEVGGITDEDKVFVRPWRILSDEEAEAYSKAEKLKKESVDDFGMAPDSLNSSVDLDVPKPKRNYALEAMRLLSATSESSSGSSKNDLMNFVPPPAPPEPVGILKKKTESTRTLDKEATRTFYKSLLEVKVKSEATLSTKGNEVPKKVRFDDEVLSAPVKVVQPLLNTSLLPVWKYPEEEEPVNPLARGILTRTYKRSSSSITHVENPPRKSSADKPEILSFSSCNGMSDSHHASSKSKTGNHRMSNRSKVDKRESSSNQLQEKPKYVVDTDEPDTNKMWQDIENCMMNDTKNPPAPRAPKNVSIKQEYIAGLQPRIRIDTNSPPKRSLFNGKPQVVARFAREMLGYSLDAVTGNSGSSRTAAAAAGKNLSTSNIPVPAKEPPLRSKVAPPRPVLNYSLEEKKIKDSLEKIDKKIKGFPGSASLLGSKGCSSIYHVKLPSPNPQRPAKRYFTEHRRTNYGKPLSHTLADDYF